MSTYNEEIEKIIKDIEININWINNNINIIKRSKSDIDKEDFECYDDRNYDQHICKQYNETINNIHKGIDKIETLQISIPLVLNDEYKNKVNEFRDFLSYQ